MKHVTQAQLENFVLGVADQDEDRPLRQHISACSTCAARLQKEAQLEELFREAAPRVNVMPVRESYWNPIRVKHVVWSAVPVMALAVGLVTILKSEAPPSITAEDTYSPSEYCRLVGGEAAVSVPGLDLDAVPSKNPEPTRPSGPYLPR